MFKFANPEYLYLLFLLPALIGLFIYSMRRAARREKKWGDRALLHALSPRRSKVRPLLKFGLLLLAVFFGVLTLARPQYGNTAGKGSRKGIEIIFALDISQSMLAEDVSPSRLEQSKRLISNLATRLENDKIGINLFAGKAYPFLPLTSDLESASFFLDSASPAMAEVQGTNIGAAIQLCDRGFSPQKNVGKAIVIITDGENHEGGAEELAQKAAKDGRHIYIVGVGSTRGAEIPTPDGPLKDRSGQIVHTTLNEEACRQLAKMGRGNYFHLDGSNLAEEQLLRALSTLQRGELASDFSGSPNELFALTTLCFILALLGELFLSEKQRSWTSRLKLFNRQS